MCRLFCFYYLPSRIVLSRKRFREHSQVVTCQGSANTVRLSGFSTDSIAEYVKNVNQLGSKIATGHLPCLIRCSNFKTTSV